MLASRSHFRRVQGFPELPRITTAARPDRLRACLFDLHAAGTQRRIHQTGYSEPSTCDRICGWLVRRCWRGWTTHGRTPSWWRCSRTSGVASGIWSQRLIAGGRSCVGGGFLVAHFIRSATILVLPHGVDVKHFPAKGVLVPTLRHNADLVGVEDDLVARLHAQSFVLQQRQERLKTTASQFLCL